jgi:hypothetical protein
MDSPGGAVPFRPWSYPPKIAEAEQRLEQHHRVYSQLQPITDRAT